MTRSCYSRTRSTLVRAVSHYLSPNSKCCLNPSRGLWSCRSICPRPISFLPRPYKMCMTGVSLPHPLHQNLSTLRVSLSKRIGSSVPNPAEPPTYVCGRYLSRNYPLSSRLLSSPLSEARSRLSRTISVTRKMRPPISISQPRLQMVSLS